MVVVCNKEHAHMIKKDGGLWHGSAAMIPELEKLGWHQVINPKREYYYEYDVTHPSYKQREQIGMEDTAEVLEVDII